MRRALLLLGLIAPVAAPRAQAPSCSGGQTFAAEALEARGWGHLHDVLRWTESVHAPTVDGYDAMPVARAVGAGRWRWLVDGLPVAGPAGIEPDGVEMLPVALAEVATVTVCPGPGLVAGAWGGPWVEIVTRRPARLAAGAVDYGNETGDPGPARYLAPDAANVDHWGPDFEAAAVAGDGLWATLRDRGLFPTDTAMAARVFDALVPGRFPARAVTVGALHARARGWRLRGGLVRGADLPHVPALGREVPVTRRHVQASAGGPLGHWRGLTLGARAHASRLSLRRPSWGALALDPDWAETRLLGSLEAVIDGADGSRWAGGAQAEAVVPDDASLRRLAVGRAWIETVTVADSARVRRLTLAATVAGGDATLGGGVSQQWPLRGGGWLVLAASAGRRAGAEAPTLADWTAVGYAGLGGRATLDVGPAGVPPQGEGVLRLTAARPVGAGWMAEGSVEVQHAEGPVEQPRFVASAPAVDGGSVVQRATGVTGAARASLGWTRGPWSVRAFAGTRRVLGRADDAFEAAHARLPALRGGAEATLRPDDRLALWLRADAHTATRWDGYPSPRVPGAVLVDVGLSRRFAGRHGRVSLAGRNVLAGWLGLEERSHPLGADLAPRLFVRLEARL